MRPAFATALLGVLLLASLREAIATRKLLGQYSSLPSFLRSARGVTYFSALTKVAPGAYDILLKRTRLQGTFFIPTDAAWGKFIQETGLNPKSKKLSSKQKKQLAAVLLYLSSDQFVYNPYYLVSNSPMQTSLGDARLRDAGLSFYRKNGKVYAKDLAGQTAHVGKSYSHVDATVKQHLIGKIYLVDKVLAPGPLRKLPQYPPAASEPKGAGPVDKP